MLNVGNDLGVVLHRLIRSFPGPLQSPSSKARTCTESIMTVFNWIRLSDTVHRVQNYPAGVQHDWAAAFSAMRTLIMSEPENSGIPTLTGKKAVDISRQHYSVPIDQSNDIHVC